MTKNQKSKLSPDHFYVDGNGQVRVNADELNEVINAARKQQRKPKVTHNPITNRSLS